MSETVNSEITDLETVKASTAVENRERFEANIQNMWGYSEVGLEAKKAAMTMLSTKTGMYARIPLVCKADDCPYASSCALIQYDLAPMGEPCPVETANIEMRYAEYRNDFDLDNSSFTDRNLVSEIINYDVMIERTKALIAKEGVPVVEVVAGIAENGEAYYRPEVSKYFEAHDKLVRRRNEAYQLMMATRRDKKDSNESQKGITEILAEISEGGFTVEKRPEKYVVDVEYTEAE